MTTSNLNSTQTIDRCSTVSTATILNEQVLAQQLVQLSPFENKQKKQQSKTVTVQPKTTKCPIEFILLKTTGSDFQSTSDYLCAENPSFEKKLRTILPSTINLDDLRDIAILMHKIISIEIVQSLWIIYRKSGIGELQSKVSTHLSDTKFWPKEVHLFMKQFEIDHIHVDSACLTFINQCIQEFNTKSEHYRRELNIKTSRLSGYNRSIEYTIEKFVQQGLQSLRIEINEQIALVQYHYTNKIFQQLYLAQNPSKNQIQLMKHLCKLKYDQEMTKHEVNFLKEKISSHLTSQSFERESIAKSPWIDRIHVSKPRQELYQQYKKVAEEARSNIMTAYIECAEGQKQHCQQQYDLAVKEIRDTQQTLPSNQSLTEAMRNLIQSHLANISKHVDCIYKLKTQLFHLKSKIQ